MTESCVNSGSVVDLFVHTRREVDKHSTGGGWRPDQFEARRHSLLRRRDRAHISGARWAIRRHADKLESIPGFPHRSHHRQFKTLLAEHGLAFIGQTADITRRDGKLYSLRDATATVIHPAHRHFDHVEKTGGGPGCAGARCEGGRGRFHEKQGTRAAGADDGGYRAAGLDKRVQALIPT